LRTVIGGPRAPRVGATDIRVGSDGRDHLVLVLAVVEHRNLLMAGRNGMSEQDRRRHRALIVFQIVVYGAMIAMFLIQLQMFFVKDW